MDYALIGFLCIELIALIAIAICKAPTAKEISEWINNL